MNPHVGVVILNYNSSRETERCLASLMDQVGVELHVCIVDNYSQHTDRARLVELKSSVPASVEFLFNRENLGYSRGNNAGLEYVWLTTHARYMSVCNPDVVCKDRETLARLAEGLAQSNGESVAPIAVIAPQVVRATGERQNPAMWRDLTTSKVMTEKAKYCWPVVRHAYYMAQCLRYVTFGKQQRVVNRNVASGSHPVFALHGSFLMFDSHVLAAYDLFPPFDSSMFLFGEELALGRRLAMNGLLSVLAADVQVMHNGDSSINSSWGTEKMRLTIRYHHESTRHVLRTLY
jgi:GT2 family glycosyltransferase